MPLDWENEDYVKLYVRDTPGFTALHHVTRAMFFELMRKVDLHGNLVCGPNYAREIASLIRWPAPDAEAAISELESAGHVCIGESDDKIGVTVTITNYVDAQNAKQSGKQRVRKYRKLQRADVTHGNAEKQSVTIRLDKIRLDERSPISPLQGDKQKRRCRLPSDWRPKESHMAKAGEHGVDLQSEAEAFADFWHGDGRTKLDWDKAFFTWLRNAKKFSNNGKRSPDTEPLPAYLRPFPGSEKQ